MFAVVVQTMAENTSAEPGVLSQLARARAQFDLALSKVLLPEFENYARQLQRLELQLAQRSDWAGAIKARDERLLVQNRIDAAMARLGEPVYVLPPDQGGEPPRDIFLQPRGAVLAGGLTVSLDRQALEGWSGESSASWTLPAIQPGGYELIVHYSSPDGPATLQFAEEFFTLTGTLEATGGDGQSRWLNLGTLRIRNPAGGLKLRPVETVPPPSMRIKEVVLVPANR